MNGQRPRERPVARAGRAGRFGMSRRVSATYDRLGLWTDGWRLPDPGEPSSDPGSDPGDRPEKTSDFNADPGDPGVPGGLVIQAGAHGNSLRSVSALEGEAQATQLGCVARAHGPAFHL